MSPVRADGQIRAHVQWTVQSRRSEAYHTVSLKEKVRHFSLHSQLKRGIPLALLGKKVQKIPLGHEGDEVALRRERGKIRNRQGKVADPAVDPCHFLVRQREQPLQEPQFVHHLERGRMDRVAAEITKKVCVFL